MRGFPDDYMAGKPFRTAGIHGQETYNIEWIRQMPPAPSSIERANGRSLTRTS
jgi:hypothetical protein